jgi:hypothetical protein
VIFLRFSPFLLQSGSEKRKERWEGVNGKVMSQLDVRLVDPNLKYIFEHNNSLSIVHCGGYLHSIYEKQKKRSPTST